MRECAKVNRTLSRYIDGETDDREDMMIRSHMDACASCRKEFSVLTGIKESFVKGSRRSLAPDYMVKRIHSALENGRYTRKILSLSGMGNFARKLIPVPVAAIVASIAFLILISGNIKTETSLEDQIFGEKAVTSDTALEVIMGTQN